MKEFSLGTQNKTYPNDRAALLVMLVRVAPILGLGLLALIIGYQLASLVPVAGRIYLQVVFLGLLFGMVILDTEPGWNMVLFISFGLVAGMVILWSGANMSQLRTWILFSFLFLISITGGAFLKSDTERAAGLLFISTILYMVGWILFMLISLPGIVRTIWTVLGLVLFTIIAIAVISHGKTRNYENSAIPLSIQLFVVLFNLCWLSSVL